MTRRLRITLPLLLLSSLVAQDADQANPRRPNVVLLFADDAGYADFGFQKSSFEAFRKLTPNIDSIAAKGATFTNAYMSGCVCSPSRAGLLTGRYQQRFGHEFNIPPGYKKGGLPLDQKTIADRMRAAGYATGIVGKWHLGYPADYHPNKRGFDWFYGCLQGSRSYFPYEKPTAHRVIQENGEPTPEGGYVTDRLGDGAVRFIREHKAKPFFLFVSFTAPHGPLHAKKADLEACAAIQRPRRRKYAAMVRSLDHNVGKILKVLRDADLEDDTLVVFTNDNGGQTLTGANNRPLRGRKGQLFEGGIRVPFCCQWPGKIAKRTIDDPIIALDLLPTFLAAAGSSLAKKADGDGTNLLPLLTGEADELPQRALYWRKGGAKGSLAIRRGRWKLLWTDRTDGAAPALFDLDADVAEKNDRSAEKPQVVADLSKLALAWDGQLAEPLWRSRSRRRRKK